jgi:FkbM family methyltransferase
LNILLTLEPIVVLPGEYSDNVWQHFDYVLTFVDSLAERGGKFCKILFPAFDLPFTETYLKTVDHAYVRPMVEKKNAICMISGNKQSSVPGELYSKRIEAAQWFHDHSHIPFDVYGQPPFELANYRGQLTPHAQKFVTLSEYRYSLCFENIYDAFWSKGYVSEKLLDCLMCETVPIYLGCYNIEEYIPLQCFIDFRQFKDYAELDQFLHDITDSQYGSYIEHIRNWVNEGNLSYYSMHRIYDKLVALADATMAEVQLAAVHWEPGLAATHADREWQVKKEPVVWSWIDLASATPSEEVLRGQLGDTETDDYASGGRGELEFDDQDKRRIVQLKRIKHVNHSLLPEFLAEMARIFGAEVFVETGTFFGDTADVARNFFREVYTVELGQDLYAAAVQRFAQYDNCHVYQGDSADVLKAILPSIKGKILFWLDAHYSKGITAKGKANTPIVAELYAIKQSGINDAIILIDDIRHFQPVDSDVDVDSALQGYPSLQHVRDIALQINRHYEFVVLGDVALVYPSANTISVSPLVRACSVSRLFDGDEAAFDTVFEAEKIIASVQDPERRVIQTLAKSVLGSGDGPIGGHYRLWYGLMLASQNRHAEACSEFQQAFDRGCKHWRVLWYFAQAAYKAGRSDAAEKAARAVLAIVPGFEEAQLLVEQSSAIQRWFRDKGDSTLRLDYPLTEDSVVFDVGGYKGEWSQQIATRYNPYIYIFEPVPHFYSLIVEKFEHNPKIKVFDFGLFDTTKTDSLVLDNDGSSLYGSADDHIEISLMDVDGFLKKHHIKEIDLIKINVEGAEYPLLRRMIDKGIVQKCGDIQVQFHTFYPDAVKLRDEIRASLENTHSLTYDYTFVWENWRRKVSLRSSRVMHRKRMGTTRNTILLSYPRSGNTWLRYCVEFLTKRLTKGYDSPGISIEDGLGKLVDIGVDCSKPPIAYKRHGYTPKEKNSYDMDNDNLILLLRNYKECIVRHVMGIRDYDRTFYSQTQGYIDGKLDYIGCLQIFEAWRGKKLLIYYEDLLRDPEPELVRMLGLLEVDKTYLSDLVDNIDFHKKQSVNLYSGNKQTRVAQSYTQGDPNKLLFHSKSLADKQKRAWDQHLEDTYPDITRKYLKRYIEPDISKMYDVIGIVFSKDRAMQLDATLRSFAMHCEDRHSIDLKVLYTTSNQFHEQQYQQLRADYGFAEFIRETHFKQDLMPLLSPRQYVLFLVDDNIFVRDFYLRDVIESLEDNRDAIGFSLRLGRNTTYCYMLDVEQKLPEFDALRQNILKHDWTAADYDFGYPLELSSSVYRVPDLLPLLTQIEFSNPNTLELMLDRNKPYYKKRTSQILCYDQSVTFCNPVNVVQTLWENKSGVEFAYSTETLARMFSNGDRVDVEKYSDMTPNSCHQEVEFVFTRTKPLVSIIILNFNRLADIRVCLESIQRHTPERHEIIVVDNASTDGSLDYLRTVPDITLLENPTNLGCPPARNQAMALAKGDYVVFLDNDTIVTSGWINTFMEHARRNPNIGLLGPRSNFVSGPQLVPKVPYRDVQSLEEFAQTFSKQNQGRTTPTHRLVGFCMFVKREVINKIGAHDPQFGKFGFEDDDYTWRAIIAGFKVAIAHDVFIHHTGGPQIRGNLEYNNLLLEAWEVFKSKWELPPKLPYGAGFDVQSVLSQGFDRNRHYVPAADRLEVKRLIYHAPEPEKAVPEPDVGEEKMHTRLIIWSPTASAEHLERCLGHVQRFSETSYDLMIELVDVGTTIPDSKLNAQASAASTPQAALKEARASEAQYVVLLSTDTVVTKRWLDSLLAVADSDPSIAAVGPTSNAAPATQKIKKRYKSVKKELQKFAVRRARKHGNAWDEVSYLGAFCLLLKTQAVGAVDGLDETLSLPEALWDLYGRLRANGFKLACAQGVYVHHAKLTDDEGGKYDDWAVTRRAATQASAAQDTPADQSVNGLTTPQPGVLPDKPKLSVCMIVRDEENALPRCLKSVQDIADELIVVDTGSKDNTISIAKDFGAKVFYFEWRDDFAAARNESLRHATGDWILQIDADEELPSSSIPFLREAISNPWCLVYVITCDNGAACRIERFVEVGRLFRNHPLIRYSRPYHETVASSAHKLTAQEPKWQLLNEPRIRIRHYGYEPSEMRSRNKLERGLHSMESHLEENPSDDYMLTRLAETYGALGRYDEAMSMLQKAVAINPKRADTHKSLGLVYFEKGMLDEAIAQLKQAVAINPNRADVHNNLGMAYYTKGLVDKATSEYREAISVEPEFVEAHYNLAVAYGDAGRVDEEISEYKKALSMNPDVAEAHCNLGAAYADKGMWDEAIDEYEKALTMNPDLPDIHFNLGIAYRQKGMVDDALAEFKKAVSIDPNNGETHFYLAAAFYANKQYGLAIEHCDKALELGYKVHPGFLQELEPYR